MLRRTVPESHSQFVQFVSTLCGQVGNPWTTGERHYENSKREEEGFKIGLSEDLYGRSVSQYNDVM